MRNQHFSALLSNTVAPIALAASFTLLSGCGGGSDGGTMSLAVTDAPVDGATSVVVTFTGVELQPDAGDAISIVYPAPRPIDLLALQGGFSASLLQDVAVPAGHYQWIRLMVASSRGTTESFIVLTDGTTHSLFVPSGAETGLKLDGGVDVPVGGAADFTVDFDLRKSVHDPQGGSADYLLRPALRLVDNSKGTGTITGTVDPLLLTAGCSAAVYVYAGAGVTPDDVGGSGAQPVASAVPLLDPSGAQRYTVAFLAAGDYTVGFTCQASADSPDTDDVILFSPVVNATVTASATLTLDLHP